MAFRIVVKDSSFIACWAIICYSNSCEGLHARFAHMHIGAVTHFIRTATKDYIFALLICILEL